MNITEEFIRTYCNESNLIENQPIDLDVAGEQIGHLEVLRDAVGMGRDGEMLTTSRIKQWQAIIVREQMRFGYDRLSLNCIGAFRPLGYEIRIADRLGLRSYDVPFAMDRFIEAVKAYTQVPVEYALSFIAHDHLMFEHIHPFADGNGRVGRAVALYMAALRGIPPVLFTNDDKRETYYKSFGESPDDTEAMYEYCKTHQVNYLQEETESATISTSDLNNAK